jgi:hypothetical protein
VAIEVGADRHMHLPAYRRECYRLSVTDAWADAAVSDAVHMAQRAGKVGPVSHRWPEQSVMSATRHSWLWV